MFFIALTSNELSQDIVAIDSQIKFIQDEIDNILDANKNPLAN